MRAPLYPFRPPKSHAMRALSLASDDASRLVLVCNTALSSSVPTSWTDALTLPMMALISGRGARTKPRNRGSQTVVTGFFIWTSSRHSARMAV